MGFNGSFSRLRFPVVLVAGLFFLHDRVPIARAQSASSSPVPASVNAITLSVAPNPARVKEKVTLAAKVTTNSQAATGGTVTFSTVGC
jgi:hypothetical protein